MTGPDEEPLWAERPLLMERADGTYELIGTSRNLEGLARWILSFGSSAEVRSPDRLAQQVARQARRVWRRYAGERKQGDKQKEGGA
jgi:predicted DNA-binding transcriptional regulator YafY